MWIPFAQKGVYLFGILSIRSISLAQIAATTEM